MTEQSDGRWTDQRAVPERCRQIATFLQSARGLVGGYLTLDPDWLGLPGSQLTKERTQFEEKNGKALGDEVQAAVNNAGILLFAAVQHLEDQLPEDRLSSC